jgi:hypothetical protein
LLKPSKRHKLSKTAEVGFGAESMVVPEGMNRELRQSDDLMVALDEG